MVQVVPCQVCGRGLRTPGSQARGYGPVCAAKLARTAPAAPAVVVPQPRPARPATALLDEIDAILTGGAR